MLMSSKAEINSDNDNEEEEEDEDIDINENNINENINEKSMIRVGFEPTPFRTSALSWRLRPLGHLTFVDILGSPMAYYDQAKGPLVISLCKDSKGFEGNQTIVEKYRKYKQTKT